uniref:Centromere/kinetochore protein zw10 n=1 Tax=Anthurium amnicola TaxID=1678845 RepID=A0A1D1Z9X3_9ARAE
MDVLFGSIDVRELLPATAQKPGDAGDEDHAATPLSAPDLRLLVDRLQVRSLRIKDRVRDYVLSHRDDFSGIFSRCAEVASRADSLSGDLSRALRVLSDGGGGEGRPVDLQIRDLASEIAGKTRELKERRCALDLVQTIAGLLGRLESAREDARAGRLLQAAETVQDLKAALLIPDGAVEEERAGREGEPVVYGLLRKEWSARLDELQGVLARLVERVVRFDPENGTVKVSSWLDVDNMGNFKVRGFLEAMEIVDGLDYGLAKVADSMIKHVMNPVISNGSMIVLTEDMDWDSDKEAEATLKLLPFPECQEPLDGRSIYSRLLQVIKFIDNYILYQNANWMLCFGRLTWPRISELVISFFLSKVVPDDASKIAEFQDIMRYTAAFESSLKEIRFISATDSGEDKLSLFANDVEVHFASRKKTEILARARNSLLQCDFTFSVDDDLKGAMHAFGVAKNKYVVDLLFQPETCFVSKAAFHLMELVHQTLKDVCLSSSRVAMEFYHAARDVLLLYKAIVPVKLEKQLGTISQAAIIMHNDCLYLSQEISGLAFEYRTNFPHGVKERAIFVDMGPSFRQMAEDVLGEQVQLVSSSLKEAIDGANGFQNTHQIQQYGLAKFSVDQVVFILEKVHIIWEPVLPKSTYRKIMWMLLDFVFGAVMRDMLLLDDIAAEETLQLQQLIHVILENLSSLFESLVDTTEKQSFSKEHLWVQLDEKIPSLGKFRKLADLLDMPLKSITMAWESRELVNCGFTSSEMINFVKAIFADSPLRMECLWRIESMNF